MKTNYFQPFKILVNFHDIRLNENSGNYFDIHYLEILKIKLQEL